MSDTDYVRTVVDGIPVLGTPAEIDITTADQLRAVLVDMASGGHRTMIVDMTSTRFCDSAGIHTLLRARQRIAAQNRELRLVVSEDSTVARILVLSGLDRVIPSFPSLEEALTASTPDGVKPAT